VLRVPELPNKHRFSPASRHKKGRALSRSFSPRNRKSITETPLLNKDWLCAFESVGSFD
jgi:hypothetical protein